MKEPNFHWPWLLFGAILSVIVLQATKKLPAANSLIEAGAYITYGFIAFVIIKMLLKSDLTNAQEKILSFITGWGAIFLIYAKFVSK